MAHHPEHTWGHTVPFGEAYYQRAIRLLAEIREDASIIAEVAAKATEAIRSGHKVYANVTTGHMPTYELINEREGNPALFEFTGSDICTPEQFAAMRAGDVLLTNHVGEEERAARDAGVYVVVFTTCYVNNRHTPPDQVHPNVNGWMPEDVASRVVDSHIPWDQGLVQAPEIPYMPVFPGSANGSCTIHWMITAEVAHALATGETPNGNRGREYVDILLTRLREARTREMERMAKTGVTMARRVIAGGRFFVRSRNQGVASEAHGVAQGLMLVNEIPQRPAGEGGDRDVMLIAAVSANDPQELAWADEARNNGNFITGIGPSHNDGLLNRLDVYFDDQCAEDAGVLAISGQQEKICPATGIINNIMMYMLIGQFVDEMCRRGAVPYFWMGGYRVGGGEFNGIMRPKCMVRGY